MFTLLQTHLVLFDRERWMVTVIGSLQERRYVHNLMQQECISVEGPPPAPKHLQFDLEIGLTLGHVKTQLN